MSRSGVNRESESEKIAEAATRVVAALSASGWRLATAESCTGGWIAKCITDIPGSSAIFGYGVVSYSNIAKEHTLGVSPLALKDNGAVSEEVVRQMADGVLARSGANIAVAVSGVAGPDGGTASKPVGTVWIAWAVRGESCQSEHRRFDGDRRAVRVQTVLHALEGIIARLQSGT